MLKKLRWRVVALTMISVAAVLLVLMGIVNIVNYANRDKSINEVLDLLADNGGSFPLLGMHGGHNGEFFGDADGLNGMEPPDGVEEPPALPESPNGENGDEYFDASPDDFRGKRKFDLSPGMSEETPYETRFFTVTFDSDGNISNLNIANIAAISQSEAESMATSAHSSEREYAYIKTDTATYKYKRIDNQSTDDDTLTSQEGTMYVFVDCSRDIDSFKSFLLNSILVSIGGLLAICILVILLSPRMIGPIIESYEKQKKFITNAGHELKTPLAVIGSCTEVIEMESGETKWTQGIHEQVDRLATLTGQLVSLAKMDEAADNSNNLETETIDFRSLVSEALKPFSLMAEQKDLGLKTNLGTTEKYVQGNKAALTELINILADNAIKYTAAGGEIVFSLTQNGKRIILTEENPAGGLTPGKQDALFERFYRGDQSHSSETSGYGIGLSMAQAIVNAHGGKISAESPDGESLIIRVEL